MNPFWHRLFAGLQASSGADPLEGQGAELADRCAPCLPCQSVVAGLAALLAALYGGGARVRRALYARGVLKARRLPAPVVSVGNLTVGGAGKTPVAAALARWWRDRGQRVAILSRGYGGRAGGVACLSDGRRLYKRPPEVGEEAYWLARTLPGVAVYTGADRYAAGAAAWRDLKPDLFLLDDGFQHFQLYRDLDVVLLDAGAPFGNGCLLPRGPLREPVSTLAAAQVLILTRYEEGRHGKVLARLAASFPGKTLLTAAIAPVALISQPGAREAPLAALKGRPLFAFAGLARPQVFWRSLLELGANLLGQRAFPDHYALTAPDLQHLVQEARRLGAEALVTTSKDWARLAEQWKAPVPLWVLEVEAQLSGPELIAACLQAQLPFSTG